MLHVGVGEALPPNTAPQRCRHPRPGIIPVTLSCSVPSENHCLVPNIPTGYTKTKLALLMVGKVCSSVNGAMVRVHLIETYPTVVRSVAMGFCMTAGGLGSALAPFFNDLVRRYLVHAWNENACARHTTNVHIIAYAHVRHTLTRYAHVYINTAHRHANARAQKNELPKSVKGKEWLKIINATGQRI